MIQPVVRRVASSSRTIKTTPRTTSQRFGDGGAVGEVVAAIDRVDDDRRPRATAASTSHQLMRWRKRRATGKSRKQSNSTKATCDVAQHLRRHDVVGGVEVEQPPSRRRCRWMRSRRPRRSACWPRLPLPRRSARPCAAPRVETSSGPTTASSGRPRGVRTRGTSSAARGDGVRLVRHGCLARRFHGRRSLSRRARRAGRLVARCAEAAISGGFDEGTGHGEVFMCIAPRHFSGSMPEC